MRQAVKAASVTAVLAAATIAAAPAHSKPLPPDSGVSMPSHGTQTTMTAPAANRATTSTSPGAVGSGRLADSTGQVLGNGTAIRPSATPESVIGTDNRTRVTSTTTYPWRAMAHITFTAHAGGSYICSGSMYGPNMILTAGHCVHDGTGWNSNFRVYPGKNGTSNPYGSCGWTTVYSVLGWTRDRNSNYDYAALKLNCSIGNTTGWLGLHWQSATLTGTSVRISGYPGEKTPYYSLWTMAGPIKSSSTYRYTYTIDTSGGQSGAPIYRGGCGTYCAEGIHTNGGSVNSGTRITQSVFNNLSSWR